MSDIKRYMPLLYDYGMEDQNDGEYVKYADYKAAIEQLQARIAELEARLKAQTRDYEKERHDYIIEYASTLL